MGGPLHFLSQVSKTPGGFVGIYHVTMSFHHGNNMKGSNASFEHGPTKGLKEYNQESLW